MKTKGSKKVYTLKKFTKYEKEILEECLKYINYWEVTNDGLNIYDQYGNKYEWR